MCGSTTNTTTTSPPAQVLSNYSNVTAQAQNVASTPYQPYTGELVAGINQGQSNAVGELQSGYGIANPYLNTGSSNLSTASAGLGGVQNYLQAGSQAGAQAQGYQQTAANYASPSSYQQFMNPYTGAAINATMAEAQNQDAQQAQQLSSNAIGQGAYGGDRAGVAQSALAGQQALANNQTIAGLNSQNYSQAMSAAQADASLYGNLASSANQSAGLYGTLGQTEGQTALGYGTLANDSANLGNIAQSTNTAGASAALQGSTLEQQNQQAQDTAAYGQFQNAIQYPFQTTSYLANIDEGIGNGSGSSTTSPGASMLSQATGAATAGLGILGAIGGTSGVSGGLSTVGSALGSLFSDKRVKEDVKPIGKTFDGQTINSFRYKGDPTVRMGLIAQDVEKRHPQAVTAGLGGIKMVDYGAATAGAARRGRFAEGGSVRSAGLGALRALRYKQFGLLDEVPDRPKIPHAMSPLEAEAQGYWHPAGNTGRPPYDTRGIGGTFGLDEKRGRYDTGGGIVSADTGLMAPLALGANPNWTPAGLEVTPTTAPPRAAPGLSAGNPSMAVLTAAPAPQPDPAAVLNALAPASTSASSGGLAGGADPNTQRNAYMGLLAAGLGMMGGTSPQAGVNIGQGGLAGLKEYTALQQQDRANQFDQAKLDIDRQTMALKIDQQQRAINAGRAAAGYAPIAFSGASSPAAVAPGLAPAGSASVGSGSVSGGLAGPPAPGSSAAGLGGVAAAAPIPATPTSPSTGADQSFWTGVSPDSNPYVLNSRANAAQALGDTVGADALRSRAASILSDGSVLMQDGTTQSMPGYLNKVSAQKTAEAQGEEAGKTQTVFDPDGNPIIVPGSTYQQIARNGGGQVNGVPVTGGASPYLKATVENNAEFNKNAISFNENYQQNAYALGSLAHIYQSYTGGRGAEAVADLDSYAKQAGVENLLPANWQNAAGGFDAAYKTAVDQSFKQLAENGATKAPATGLREALLTTPRPDADPAARFKLITDKLASLNYSHDMYGSFLNGNDPNVGRAIQTFQKTANYGDYINKARAGTPLPAGMSPAAGRMVLGPTGSQPAAPTQGQAQPAGALSVGTVSKGYRYIGGDPSSRSSWQPAP